MWYYAFLVVAVLLIPFPIILAYRIEKKAISFNEFANDVWLDTSEIDANEWRIEDKHKCTLVKGIASNPSEIGFAEFGVFADNSYRI